MPPNTPEPPKLPHPVRDGVGFFAAAFAALMRAFWPARPAAEQAESDNGETAEADGETDGAPEPGRSGPVARVAPYPIND